MKCLLVFCFVVRLVQSVVLPGGLGGKSRSGEGGGYSGDFFRAVFLFVFIVFLSMVRSWSAGAVFF